MNHILSAEQFDQAQLAQLFQEADQFKETDVDIVDKRQVMGTHYGRIMLSMFFEASTRTKFSFDIAAKKLGIAVVGTENATDFSSIAKGESIEDMIKVFNGYGVDAINLRTKEEGQADRAASVSEVAIINGGDGKGEHPTQAGTDVYTIHNEWGRLDNLKVAIGGDLANGRTARSLAKVLSMYPGNQITFVSIPELQIGEDVKAHLTQNGTEFKETDEMYDALREANVVYWTRLQSERVSEKERKKLKKAQRRFILDAAALEVMLLDATILHPLPRLGEIPTSTDADSRAKYFEQASNGLYLRMAMLNQIMLARA